MCYCPAKQTRRPVNIQLPTVCMQKGQRSQYMQTQMVISTMEFGSYEQNELASARDSACYDNCSLHSLHWLSYHYTYCKAMKWPFCIRYVELCGRFPTSWSCLRGNRCRQEPKVGGRRLADRGEIGWVIWGTCWWEFCQGNIIGFRICYCDDLYGPLILCFHKDDMSWKPFPCY